MKITIIYKQHNLKSQTSCRYFSPTFHKITNCHSNQRLRNLMAKNIYKLFPHIIWALHCTDLTKHIPIFPVIRPQNNTVAGNRWPPAAG